MQIASEKKPRFDNYICKDCAWYWIGVGNVPDQDKD